LVRPDDEDGAEVVRKPAADGWSALDHAAHVARSFEAVAEALRLVSIEDEPVVALAPERPEPAAVGIDDVLARLTAAAEAAAAAVEHIKGKDWNRRGRLSEGASVTALDLARHGVHEGVHHLRAAEHAIEEARFPA
jgi:hypothetical protein